MVKINIVKARNRALIEELEDQLDIEAADAAVAEAKAKGEKPIPWEEAKKILFHHQDTKAQ